MSRVIVPLQKLSIVLYCIVLYCIVLYCTVLYCIVLDCIIVLIGAQSFQIKSKRHRAESLKLAANGRYLMSKSPPYYFCLTYIRTFILLSRVEDEINVPIALSAFRDNLLSTKCMLSLFSCFRNPPNSDKNYRIFNVRT